jgi:hypothetical protein
MTAVAVCVRQFDNQGAEKNTKKFLKKSITFSFRTHLSAFQFRAVRQHLAALPIDLYSHQYFMIPFSSPVALPTYLWGEPLRTLLSAAYFDKQLLPASQRPLG